MLALEAVVTGSAMPSRRMRLWNAVVERAGQGAVSIEHVCAVVLEVAAVDGAAIVVSLASGLRETVYVSGDGASDIEELVQTMGEGPGVDATGNGPVLAGDLATEESQVRWPTFAPAAVAGGTRAAFGFPLQVGGIRLGVVDLYRAAPGELGPDQLADTLILVDAACTLLLDIPGGSFNAASGTGSITSARLIRRSIRRPGWSPCSSASARRSH